MKSIILASSSPRRRELLRRMGLRFRVVTSPYQEDTTLRLPPRKLVAFLSRGKALAVASRHRNSIIIAADTVVVCRDKVFGKPHTRRRAAQMLRTLIGRSHSVFTGLTVVDTKTGKLITKVVETKVFFNRLTSREIAAYVNSGEPLNKAGAYAIQALGGLLVKKIMGDYSNVVGLPMHPLAAILKKFGVRIL